jgi:hypothetical protein
MHTYAKLKDGRLMVVWSENTDEETMHGYPAEREHDRDCECDTYDKWDYADVVRTDTNRFMADR